MRVVVMGVTSTGKSLMGTQLAAALGGRFVDGDDLHPPANRAKMAEGTPLTDADRWPWLDHVGAVLAEDTCIVTACSALKRSYRDRIRAVADGVVFVHLHGPKDVIATRMAAREGHFMPVSLLESQLATLEPPEGEARVVPADITQPPDRLLTDILDALRRLT